VLVQAPAAESGNPCLFRITSDWMEPDNYHWMDKEVRATIEVGEMIEELEQMRGTLHLR
jgi:hypothetical protein